jgi:probable F420-dependent oxidoreductase
MHIGFSTMNSGPPDLRPDDLARTLEERGFESLWLGEHNHLPATRRTPYPPTGSDAPDQYRHMMDPFASLASAAAVTSTLRLGTGVMLLLEQHVLSSAKVLATLDVLSRGRLMVGVGVGWNAEELANVAPQISWAQRYRALAEYVDALGVLWANEEPAFDGEFVKFDKVWSYPKPVQQPRPPVLFGGTGRLAMAHVARWADGWFPIDFGVKAFSVMISRMHAAAETEGRDPATIPISVMAQGINRERFEDYRQLGVERLVISIPPTEVMPASETMRFVDEITPFVTELA